MQIISKRVEKEINGQTKTSRLSRIKQMQYFVQQRHILVRRNHINMIRLNFQAIADLNDRHSGNPLKQFNHHIFVCRVKMLNNHKGDTTFIRNISQQNFKCFKPSR